MIGMTLLSLLFLLAVFAPLFSPYTYFETHLSLKNQPPSWQFWFGTDELGRDLFTRVWWGARISLFVGITASLLDLFIGVCYGATAGLLRGKKEEAMMRLVDLLSSIPYLLIVILLMVVIGPGLSSIIYALAITGWMGMARIVRGQILQLRELDFVKAAVALGASKRRLLFVHLIPNCIGPILVTLTLTIPSAIFAEAFLSFLGLGVQAPIASWGTMANDGLPALRYYPWRLFFPATFISLTMLSFHLIGDALRDLLDPKTAFSPELTLSKRRKAASSLPPPLSLPQDLPLLSVKNLSLSFQMEDHVIDTLHSLTFSLQKGETLGIVGESGCGKSTLAKALLQLTPPAAFFQGEALYGGKNLLSCSEKEMQQIRGKEISMIFQDPMTSLNPTTKIGQQIVEGYQWHHGSLSRKEKRAYAIEMLRLVGMPFPEEICNRYPHTLSGGMRQRVMIAIALASKPNIVIADEPTTALDLTIQSQILYLLEELQQKLSMSMILITHDLSLVAHFCQRVIVMYDGTIVEEASVEELFSSPKHPYTQKLLDSIPRLDRKRGTPLNPIQGTLSSSLQRPAGCRFAPRCDRALSLCKECAPEKKQINQSHSCSCHLYD